MFLTPRETLILKELLHSASPVTVERLMSLLKVSKRTVYRELANLELSLESIGAKLEKESRGRFRLLAEDAAKAKILSIVSEERRSLGNGQRGMDVGEYHVFCPVTGRLCFHFVERFFTIR